MRTRTLAVALLSCLLCACITGGVDSEDLVEATEISPEQRLEYAKAAYEADPDNPQANLDLARAWTTLERPNWRRAERFAKFAFDSGELDAPAGRVLGKIYWEIGQPIETINCWRTARAAEPGVVRDSDYLYALRTALMTASTFKSYDTALLLRYELRDFIEARRSDLDSPLPFGPGGTFAIDIDATLQDGVTVYDADDMDRMDAECAVEIYDDGDGLERLRLEVFVDGVSLEGEFWLDDELCTVSVERFPFGENPWS